MILLTAAAILLAHAGHWTAALTFALPLAFLVGRKSAIRETGVGMVKTGGRRIVTGRLM